MSVWGKGRERRPVGIGGSGLCAHSQSLYAESARGLVLHSARCDWRLPAAARAYHTRSKLSRRCVGSSVARVPRSTAAPDAISPEISRVGRRPLAEPSPRGAAERRGARRAQRQCATVSRSCTVRNDRARARKRYQQKLSRPHGATLSCDGSPIIWRWPARRQGLEGPSLF